MARSIKERIVDGISSFDRISAIASENNISLEEARLVYKYGYSLEDAKEVTEKSSKMDFLMSSIFEKVSYLKFSPKVYRKQVHGILLVSETEEALMCLEDIVNYAFNNGNESFLEMIEKETKNRPLVISDSSVLGLRDKSTAYYIDDNDFIHLDIPKDDMVSLVDSSNDLFHEMTHYLDDSKKYSSESDKIRTTFEMINGQLLEEYYSQYFDKKNIPNSMETVLKKVFDFFKVHLIAKGISIKKELDYAEYFELSKKYVQQEELVQKWKDEIEEKYPDFSEEDKKEKLEQKQFIERQNYISFMGSIYDIYDGLAGGLLNTFLKIPGHGFMYYSLPEKVLSEFIAEVAEIYTASGEDMFLFEFGPEVTEQLVDLYKDFLQSLEMESNQDEKTVLIDNDETKSSNDDYLDELKTDKKNSELQEMLYGDVGDVDFVDEITPGDDMIELSENSELQAMLDDQPEINTEISNTKTM